MEELTPGQKAARLRKVRGLTQQQVASAVGISRVYLNNIEHDQAQNVRRLILDAIAREVGLTDWAALESFVLPGPLGLSSSAQPTTRELNELRKEVKALRERLAAVLGVSNHNHNGSGMAALAARPTPDLVFAGA